MTGVQTCALPIYQYNIMGSECCKIDDESDARSACIIPEGIGEIPASELKDSVVTPEKLKSLTINQIASIEIHSSKLKAKKNPRPTLHITLYENKDSTTEKMNSFSDDSNNIITTIIKMSSEVCRNTLSPLLLPVPSVKSSKTRFGGIMSWNHNDLKVPSPNYFEMNSLCEGDLPLRKAATNFKVEPVHFRIERKGSVTDEYTIEECIGKGSYGVIMKIRLKDIDFYRALKIISKDHCQATNTLVDEIEIIKKLVLITINNRIIQI